MKDKTVLIIGASDGIGFETAKIFKEAGAIVYNGSRTKCKVKGVRNLTVDVTNPETIGKAIETIEQEQNRLDTIVYCAGTSIASPADLTERADYTYLFSVNLFGAIEIVKHGVPLMKKTGGGRIILISSLVGIVPAPYEAFYSASKAALNTLAFELNIELNPDNINVIALLPGGVATDFSYKRKVYVESVENEEELKSELNAVHTITETEQKGESPCATAKAIYKAATCSRPPVIKILGFKNKLSAAAYTIMPKKLSMAILKKKFGVPQPKHDDHKHDTISDS